MENENNRCGRCNFFARYYTRGVKKFNKTRFGWCTEFGCEVETDGKCEAFKHKLRTGRRNWILKVSINNLLTEITEIRKILEAENEEFGTDDV